MIIGSSLPFLALRHTVNLDLSCVLDIFFVRGRSDDDRSGAISVYEKCRIPLTNIREVLQLIKEVYTQRIIGVHIYKSKAVDVL